MRRFVSSLALYYFVLAFFNPFSITITSLGEKRPTLSAFRTCVQFALVWFCLFPFPLGVREGLWLLIVALPELFSSCFGVVQAKFDYCQDLFLICTYLSLAVVEVEYYGMRRRRPIFPVHRSLRVNGHEND